MIQSVMKLVGLGGSLGGAVGGKEDGSGILSIASGILTTAYPPAGMALGLMASIPGLLDFAKEQDPEKGEQLEESMTEYYAAMESLAEEAKKVDALVDQMSDEQVHNFGRQQGYF